MPHWTWLLSQPSRVGNTIPRPGNTTLTLPLGIVGNGKNMTHGHMHTRYSSHGGRRSLQHDDERSPYAGHHSADSVVDLHHNYNVRTTGLKPYYHYHHPPHPPRDGAGDSDQLQIHYNGIRVESELHNQQNTAIGLACLGQEEMKKKKRKSALFWIVLVLAFSLMNIIQLLVQTSSRV